MPKILLPGIACYEWSLTSCHIKPHFITLHNIESHVAFHFIVLCYVTLCCMKIWTSGWTDTDRRANMCSHVLLMKRASVRGGGGGGGGGTDTDMVYYVGHRPIHNQKKTRQRKKEGDEGWSGG